MDGSECPAQFIKSPSEQIGWVSLIFEFIKTVIDVNFIILWSIFRYFAPAAKKDVKGEVVVVTGAAGYIGKRLALRFAERGMKKNYFLSNDMKIVLFENDSTGRSFGKLIQSKGILLHQVPPSVPKCT